MKITNTIVSVLITCLPFFLDAAPTPGLGSSALIADSRNWFLRAHGVDFVMSGLPWQMSPKTWLASLAENEGNRSPDNIDGMSPGQTRVILNYFHNSVADLKFRFEIIETNKPLTVDQLIKQWMRDYTSLGFDVLGTRFFTENSQRGLVVDTWHKKSSLKSRQVIFTRGAQAVILSCTGPKTALEKHLEDCNQLTKNFKFLAN